MRGCEVVWAIKDKSIGQTFFDEGAATHFLPHLSESSAPNKVRVHKRTKYTIGQDGGSKKKAEECGSALGPDWSVNLQLTGRDQYKVTHAMEAHYCDCIIEGGLLYNHCSVILFSPQTFPQVHIEYECTATDILTPEQLQARGLSPSDLSHSQSQSGSDNTEASLQNTGTPKRSLEPEFKVKPDWPVYVVLSNGHVYGCDIVVSATGVVPNTGWLREAVKNDKLRLAEDGGIIVDTAMRSSMECVYAAGDVCSVEWEGHSKTWFQVT